MKKVLKVTSVCLLIVLVLAAMCISCKADDAGKTESQPTDLTGEVGQETETTNGGTAAGQTDESSDGSEGENQNPKGAGNSETVRTEVLVFVHLLILTFLLPILIRGIKDFLHSLKNIKSAIGNFYDAMSIIVRVVYCILGAVSLFFGYLSIKGELLTSNNKLVCGVNCGVCFVLFVLFLIINLSFTKDIRVLTQSGDPENRKHTLINDAFIGLLTLLTVVIAIIELLEPYLNIFSII